MDGDKTKQTRAKAAQKSTGKTTGKTTGRSTGRPVDFGDLDAFVGFQLHKARNVAAGVIGRLIAPDNAPGHFPILYLIDRNPGRTQTAIAEAVGLDRSSLVPILNRFEKAGWVTRAPAPDDRRAHRLMLTDDGRARLAKLYDQVAGLEDRISTSLGDGGQANMLDGLHRIQKELEEG